jgi:phosphoglycolate phosphatase
MPVLQALIFDLDGTLVDSVPDLRQALNAMLRDQGRRELTLDETKAMTGDGMMPMIERAYAATGGVPPGLNSYASFQGFIKHYRSLTPDPAQVYPKAREMLARYHGMGVKLGVCTNKQEAATAQILEQLGLKRYFAFIAGGDTFPVHKPHPGHVQGVLEKLDVAPAHGAMIGDGPNDVLSAHGAGVACIVVTHGYGADYERLGADKLIGGFDELPAALGELGFDSG